MTVTTAYTVDELSEFDEGHPPRSPSAALQKTIQIGNICNNAFKNEHGVNVGQSTDVALLNVLNVFGYEDQRQVSRLRRARSVDTKLTPSSTSRTSPGPPRSLSTPRTSIWSCLEPYPPRRTLRSSST
jgi:Ca2+-transporting ATPase